MNGDDREFIIPTDDPLVDWEPSYIKASRDLNEASRALWGELLESFRPLVEWLSRHLPHSQRNA